MDKLTPGQLRDLADTLFAESAQMLSAADIIKYQMAETLRDEAARREAAAKTELVQTIQVGEVVAPPARICGTIGEREGLGSAAAEYKQILDDFRKGEKPPFPPAPPAPFRLEVGKSYARRDGLKPVQIVSVDKDPRSLYPFNSLGDCYTADGLWLAGNVCGKDLVALWQAEEKAQQTDAECISLSTADGRICILASVHDRIVAAMQKRIEAQAQEIAYFRELSTEQTAE